MSTISKINSVNYQISSNNYAHRPKPQTILDRIFNKKVYAKVTNPSPLNMKDVRNKLAQKRHEAAQIALTPSPLNRDTLDRLLEMFPQYKQRLKNSSAKGDTKAKKELKSLRFAYANQLAKACGEIKDILDTKNSEIDHDKMQLLREKLSNALKIVSLDTDPLDRGFHHFLQRLSFQVKVQAEGMKSLEEIGKNALTNWRNPSKNNEVRNEPQNPNFATHLADNVEEVFHNMPGNHWEGGLNYIKWAVKNIAEAFFAFIDNQISGCHVFYNSYERGNVDMWIGDFVVTNLDNNREHKLRTHVGPGPINDPTLIKAQIKWEKAMGIPHVVHTLEFNQKKGETTRLKNMGSLVNDNSNEKIGEAPLLSLMGTPYDGKIAKGKKNFSDIKKVDNFHQQLEKELLTNLQNKRTIPGEIKHYDGFALPEHLLTENDIRETIETSKKVFTLALGNEPLNPNSDEKQNKRLSAAMLAGFNALLSIKVMIKLGSLLDGLPADRKANVISAVIERECKQCADRGPLANATIIAFTKMIEKGALNDQDMHQIIGLLVGRAMIAGPNRQMVESRRQPFIDLFRIIGQNPAGFVQELKNFVGAREGSPSPIRFEPSYTCESEQGKNSSNPKNHQT